MDSASYTASNPSDSSNKTTLKLKDTDGNEITLNLTDTYTTVSKNTDHTITFKRNDGSDPVSISLDDLNGASKEALTTAAAKATTQVIEGANVSSVDDTNAGNTDGPHIYKVNVSNLGVKVADGQKTSVALSDGLVFGNGTNTTASVGQNGAITFNVSNDAIKTQAKDAINMTAGTNVNVGTETSPDSLSKTFTISATHNALKSATITSKSNDVSTLTITGNDGDTASVDIKNTHLTVTKDSKAKTVTFTSNDGTTPATTLSLSDLGSASTADMNAAKAAASPEVKAGTNASLGTVETNQTDQHNGSQLYALQQKVTNGGWDIIGDNENKSTHIGNDKTVSFKSGKNSTVSVTGTDTGAEVKVDVNTAQISTNDAHQATATVQVLPMPARLSMPLTVLPGMYRRKMVRFSRSRLAIPSLLMLAITSSWPRMTRALPMAWLRMSIRIVFAWAAVKIQMATGRAAYSSASRLAAVQTRMKEITSLDLLIPLGTWRKW